MIVGIAASDGQGNMMIQVEDLLDPETHIKTFIEQMAENWCFGDLIEVENIVATCVMDVTPEVAEYIEQQLMVYYGLLEETE
jgi:hypothetical protein